MKKRRGQSTVEYVIVFTAIAAAVIFAALNLIKPAVNQVYSNATSSVKSSSGYFSNQIGMNKFNVTP